MENLQREPAFQFLAQDLDGDQQVEEPQQVQPWGYYGHQGAPRENYPWDLEVGLERLGLVDRDNGPPVPPGHHAPESWTELQELMLDYSRETLRDDPDLEERRARIASINHIRASNPPWLTLNMAERDHRCWCEHLLQTIELDQGAWEFLSQVAKTQSLGQFEINRILNHLFKDSSSQRQSERNSPSRWLARTCTESLNAMADWALWDCQEQRGKGLQFIKVDESSWNFGWDWVDMRASNSSRPSYSMPRSSSSTNWQPSSSSGRWGSGR